MQLEILSSRIKEQCDWEIVVSPEVKSFLAKEAYEPEFGARPIKRVVQKYIENPLAKRILAWDSEKGNVIQVSLLDNEIVFS